MNLRILGYIVLAEDDRGFMYGRDVDQRRIYGRVTIDKKGNKILTIYDDNKFTKEDIKTSLIIYEEGMKDD